MSLYIGSHRLVVMNVSISPNQSKVVLAASNDNMARIWNLSDQACKVGVATCHTTTILILAPPLSPISILYWDTQLKSWLQSF